MFSFVVRGEGIKKNFIVFNNAEHARSGLGSRTIYKMHDVQAAEDLNSKKSLLNKVDQ